jgi:microfibrillar-associated protein 1
MTSKATLVNVAHDATACARAAFNFRDNNRHPQPLTPPTTMPPKRMTANPVRAPRYRPGKPVAPEPESSEEEESSSESEAETKAPPKPVYIKKKPTGTPASAPALKDVDLSKRFSEGAAAEAARVEAEEEKGSADEYTTEESGSEEEESEEEESEEEEEAPRKVLLRPTFVPKSKRGASAAATGVDYAEKQKTEEEERRKQEAAELLELHLKRDAEAKAAGRKGWDDDGDEGEVDDTDGTDPAAERAAWKLRELIRIKREREALAAIEKERAEIERRREMDPALREKEDLEFVREQRKEKMEQRGKMGFMQKFYHKGAFYQDSEILKRNYATAEVEDRAKNREVLPKYMQVRGDEVGKRGRTKWTHLTAEDTTLLAGDNPWEKKKGGLGGFGGAGTGTGGNRVPIAAGVDERFRPDDRTRPGAGPSDRFGGRDDGPRGREGGERSRRDDRGFDRDDRRPRDDGDRRRDEGPRRSRWDDDGGRRPPDGPRGDRERGGRGGDSYIPGRDDDRERKRPHSPKDRGYDAEKRRRRDASPVS